MERFKAYITNLLSFVIIVFLLTSCGLIFGEYFDHSEYYINNQSDYDLHVEVSSRIVEIDTTYFAHKSIVKIGESRGGSPSIAFEVIRFYLSTNDSSNNKLAYELIPVTDDRWEVIEDNSTKNYKDLVYELLIENSDLDLN